MFHNLSCKNESLGFPGTRMLQQEPEISDESKRVEYETKALDGVVKRL